MFDLQALAFQADITRVFTFMVGRELGGRTYPQIGVPDPHHGISHHRNDAEKLAKLSKINRHHVELLTHLLGRLQDAQDGDGTLLDHAMLLHGAGMGDGDQHTPYNLPITLMGGGCGQLAGNRHLVYDLHTPFMNLGLTLLEKVGVKVDRISDSTGPLTGV
jgi:hypothetical protein